MTWTAPDDAAPQPVRIVPLGAEVASVDVQPDLPPVPVPLRPMTTADLLDGGFAILRRRPQEVLLLAAMILLPVELVAVLLYRDALGSTSFGGLGEVTAAFNGEEVSGPGAGSALASQAVSVIGLSLLAGALAVLVDGWYRGESVTAGAAARVMLRRAFPLLIAACIVKLLEGAGLVALGIGAYVAMALCHVVSPVVTVERLGPIAAVGRSVSLCRRRMGTALLLPGLVALTDLVVGFGFLAIPELVVPLMPGDLAWLARGAGQLGAELVIGPFTAGVAVLFHIDLRIRSEAYDVMIRAQQLAP